MKTEFLQNFKVNDQPLPKEVIDAILAENGRDIEAAKKPYADYEALKDQLKTARDGLKAFEGVDVGTLQGKITELQDQLKAKDGEWQKKLDDLAFNGVMADCITAAKGKDQKAVLAMLEDKMEEIRTSKDQKAAANAAIEALKKDKEYLFDAPTPPPYAHGTGSAEVQKGKGVSGLRDALHAELIITGAEKFRKCRKIPENVLFSGIFWWRLQDSNL